MTPSPSGESGAMNLTQLHNTGINLVENLCSVVAMPVEMVIRPLYGTRYFPVPIVFLTTLLMLFLPLFAALTNSAAQLLPIAHRSAPAGLFGIGSLAKLYFALSFIHGIRLWRRMLDMSKETLSTFEGPPLPVLDLIPGSQSFWRTRIVFEPLIVCAAATVLGRFLIFESGLVTYLQLAAFSLAMKSFIGWYRGWEYLRTLLDGQAAASIIARMVDSRATAQDLATIHFARFPKNLSEDLRRGVISHFARAFAPEPEPSKESSARSEDSRNQGEPHDDKP